MLAGIDRPSYEILETAEELPDCLRTFGRAKLLLLLRRNEPTTVRHMVKLGFKKTRVWKMFRAFERSKLILERNRLYRLTDKGQQIASVLQTDTLISSWLDREAFTRNQLQRPKIIHLEDDI